MTSDNPYRRGYASTWGSKYGSQLSVQTKLFGILPQSSSIKWSAKHKKTVTQERVDEFIASKWQGIRQKKYFRNALADTLVRGKEQVKSYGLSLISQFMPWVFSNDFLFDPLRQILFCIKTGRDPKNHQQIFANVPPNVINQVVQQAIFQSVKYQSNYLQKALTYFKNNQIGIIQRIMDVASKIKNSIVAGITKVGQFAKKLFVGIKDKVVSIVQPIANFVSNAGKWVARVFVGTKVKTDDSATLAEIIPQKVKLQSEFKMAMASLIQYIFQDLRCYGGIVINFKYLQNINLKKMVNGLPYYYTYDNPNIFITCRQSFPSVYIKSPNGVLQKVPQSIFNIQYLRGIVTQKILQQGGSIYKQYVRQVTPARWTAEQQKTFKDKYLPVDLRKPQSEQAQLQSYFSQQASLINAATTSETLEDKSQSVGQQENTGSKL